MVQGPTFLSLPANQGPAQGRGPTGIWNLAHSISDPRAEISAILVMVCRSSTTSRGTTYWFHNFCFPMSRLSGLRMRNFPGLMCLPKSTEKQRQLSNEGKDKHDPRSQFTRLST